MRLIAVCIAAALPMAAQLITGSITGNVVDPSRLAINGARVELAHAATGRVRTSISDAAGVFVISGLEAGEYRIGITQQGFKKAERKGIVLDTGQRLALGEMVLDIGNVSETVSVTAERAVVATQSADRSDLINSQQVDGLLNLGRNVTALVALVPGVVLTRDSDALSRTSDFNVQGSRRTMNNVSIDGVPSTDVGNGFALKLNVSQDAVAEVKVLVSNYQAEYGRMAGSNVHVVTKSGTREFHGLFGYLKRHEQFNANDFFRNQNGLAKPRYRFNTYTYNLGGPVYIPGKWNQSRNRMFFFWGQEYWPARRSFSPQLTVPTEGERNGDFSQSLDVGGRLIVVRDPTDRSPYPGNRVPPARIDPSGQALLKRFPAANFFDRAISRGNYNYIATSETTDPTRTDTGKIDYNFNANNFVTAGYNGFFEKHEGQFGLPTSAGNWDQWPHAFHGKSYGTTVRYTRVVNAGLINEIHFGWLHHPEFTTTPDAVVQSNTRSAAGFRAGQFTPANNPSSLLPDATFGGVPNPANLSKDGRFPFTALNNVYNIDEKLTWTRGAHTIKAGAYIERFQRDIGEPVVFAGSFDFGINANNPLDTGYAYSNALGGVFNSYTEAQGKPYLETRNNLFEFFAQDNWRVNSKLTLDMGLRLYAMPPIYEINDRIAGFDPRRFDTSKQVRLISPGVNAQNQRIGVHPVTRAAFPASLIGAIAPGVGDPFNGMVTASTDKSVPRALTDTPAISWGPRFGFAWDPFGKGNTAVRGGFGMFYNRPNFGNWTRPHAAQPPIIVTPVVNFGTIATLNTSSGLLFPSNVLGYDPSVSMPQVMNFSLSVQRNIGFGTVVDAAYSGSLGRHLMWLRPLNAIPFGANFNPRNFDPTLTGNRPLSPAFLRPVIGYNNINQRELNATSNYHSLQVTANRRFQGGLQFGLAWTWSKALDYVDEDTNVISGLVPLRVWNYGLAAFDRTHVVKINWLWQIPTGNWSHPVARHVFQGWELDGIASFVSGSPQGVGFTTTIPIDITGSPTDGARTVVTGNPVLPKSQRTFGRNFATEVFRLPAIGTYGNAAKTVFRGPGTNNFDVAIFKNFPVREKARIQIRSKMFNAFNHTQFSAVDTTARYDPQGNQLNSRFGQFTAAASARVIQFSLRFYY
jgi:hypothetical protein